MAFLQSSATSLIKSVSSSVRFSNTLYVKNTSFDLRDFNDANVFKIAYLIWKEKNLEEKYE